MKSRFPGFPVEGIQFLSDLKANNDREWFNPRKAVFEELIRQPMLRLVEAVHLEMARFAPDYVGEPAKCVYRIYRDTRFSKNKTPYKTYTSALFWRTGTPKDDLASFYFGISPEGVDCGSGLYFPPTDILRPVREHIAAESAAFRATFDSKRVRKLFGEMKGESMSRVPQGYDPAHPEIELLKQKQFLLWAKLDPALATTPKLFTELVTRMEAAVPFVEFLNRPLLKRNAKQKREALFLD